MSEANLPVFNKDQVLNIYSFMITVRKQNPNIDFTNKETAFEFYTKVSEFCNSIFKDIKFTNKEVKEIVNEYISFHSIIDDLIEKWKDLNRVLFSVSTAYRRNIDYSGTRYHYVRFKDNSVLTIGYLYIPEIQRYVFTTSTCGYEDSFRKIISRDKIIGRIKSGAFVIISKMVEAPTTNQVDEKGNIVISSTEVNPGITSYRNVMYNIAINILLYYYNGINKGFHLFMPHRLDEEFKEYLVSKFFIINEPENVTTNSEIEENN